MFDQIDSHFGIQKHGRLFLSFKDQPYFCDVY